MKKFSKFFSIKTPLVVKFCGKSEINMFKEKGWQVINADEAYRDPVYRLTPKTLPAGESLIWALAKQTGRYDKQLRYPGEDESYEAPAMDKLKL